MTNATEQKLDNLETHINDCIETNRKFEEKVKEAAKILISINDALKTIN